MSHESRDGPMAHNCSVKTKKSAGQRPCINTNDRLALMLSPSRSARWDPPISCLIGRRQWQTTLPSGRQSGLDIPNLPSAEAENLASCTASSAKQCRSNPVSGRGLPKTGIFQISAGDYRRFRSRSGQFGSPETDSQFAKARHWRAFLRLLRVKSPGVGLVGWGGRIRTLRWWIGI